MTAGYYIRTKEHREKMSEVLKGKKRPPFSERWRKRMSESGKNKIFTKKHRENLSKNHKGMLGKYHSKKTRKKLSKLFKGKTAWNKGKKLHYQVWIKGKHHSEETRRKISKVTRKGEKCHFWKGGVTSINMKIRQSLEYKLWREAVLKRDNYICIWCKQRGGKLQVDHIKPFALFPELRFSIDNGRTLCIDCHKKTSSYLNNKKCRIGDQKITDMFNEL